ncbi:MAG: OmpA family protein [Betaproteobacteria bacterium]|nr:OmpA family protein [Betaproteobacteria bacterium]
MIKQVYKPLTLATSVVLLGMASLAQAQQVKDIVADTKVEVPYMIDQRGVVARNSTGLCWRTGYWTPQAAAANTAAGCACDKDLLPKEKCEPPAPPAVTPPPPAVVPPPVKPTVEKVTLNADALFDFDKATLRPEGKAKLDDLAGKTKGIKLEVIIAVGHADRIGSDKYNLKLSERRAAAVKTYLVEKGIEPNRVYTEGKGEKQSVTGDNCKKMGRESGGNKKLVACLQPDRRVEIEVIGTQQK